MTIAYWIVAGVLALFYLYGGGIKVVQTREQLQPMMAWVDRTPMPAVRTIGGHFPPSGGHPTTGPAEVRLGFHRLRARIGTPADSPKPTHPGPGRPRGSKNRLKSKRPPYRKTKPTTSKHTE